MRPVVRSRSLVPVEKVGPRPLPSMGAPLDRSGVGLDDLLDAPDLVDARLAVAPVALEMGLESARAQLLRQLPGDALVSLDAVWPGAATTEEGWYLRSGALTVLGHPGDGERVASAGLESQPTSHALRLLQSVARTILGDLSGARAALAPALDAAPGNPVLNAQQAVVLARQGHVDDAGALLERVALETPDHPAVAWARSAVRTVRADRARSGARPVPDDTPRSPSPSGLYAVHEELLDEPLDDRESATVESATIEATPDLAFADEEHGDLVTAAFVNLGRRLAHTTDDGLIRMARTLLRACSTGGTLASACRPEDAHAARQVLTALLVVIRQDAAVSSPLGTLMAHWYPLVRESFESDSGDRLGEASRVLSRAGASVPPAVGRLLEVLLEGATRAGGTAHDREAATCPRQGVTGEVSVFTPLAHDRGPLVPVRLGLSLLTDSAATRAFARSQVIEEAPTVPPYGELTGEGMGSTRANAEPLRAVPAGPSAGATLPVLLCAAGAVLAALNGAALLTGVLGAGAALLVLRRAPGTSD